jgi:hypothetical protein
LKALLAGSAVGIAGSIFAGSFAAGMIGSMVENTVSGASSEDIYDAVFNSVPLMLAMIATGAAFCFTGAYVAARMAPSAPEIHALAAGLLGVALLMAYVEEVPPRWAHAAGTAVVIGVSLLAGKVAGNRKEADREAHGIIPPPVPVRQPPHPQPPPLPQAEPDVTVNAG